MKKIASTFAAAAFLVLGSVTLTAAKASAEPVIAEYVSGGGLMPGYAKVQIFASGAVVASSQRFNDPVQTTELARLSATSVAHLTAKLANIPQAELKDTDEGSPFCTDAGSATYIAHNANGAVRLYQTSGCHQFVRDDGLGDDVKALLDAMMTLEY